MRENENAKEKLELWMVEEGASERFDEIAIEEGETRSPEVYKCINILVY